MKLCINCQHFDPIVSVCDSPNNGTSLVTGRVNSRMAVAERTNIFPNQCGPDAVKFEQRKATPRVLFPEPPEPPPNRVFNPDSGIKSVAARLFGRIFNTRNKKENE